MRLLNILFFIPFLYILSGCAPPSQNNPAPKTYWETTNLSEADFKDYYNSNLDYELTKNPRLIITNVSHIADDKFKIWFAKNKDKYFM